MSKNNKYIHLKRGKKEEGKQSNKLLSKNPIFNDWFQIKPSSIKFLSKSKILRLLPIKS